MNDLEPSWLRSFVAIAQVGSVTRAAERVNRTQSAVSTQLQQLEASVGVRLVKRSTRSLSLTAEGERFLPHALRLLELQEVARAAVQPPAEAAVFRVGLSEYFLPSRLPDLLSLLRDAQPLARFELSWASSTALRRGWSEGALDLAVLTSTQAIPGARLLRREPLSWVSAPGWLPNAESPLPLVLLGADCPVRVLALAALARAARPHFLQLSCTGRHGAVAALRAGWGVGCLNQAAIPPDLDVLTRREPRSWPSPGRLAFHVLAKPTLQDTVRLLRSWAAG
jgi:DNA-binding transcriptional LysR family regulator